MEAVFLCTHIIMLLCIVVVFRTYLSNYVHSDEQTVSIPRFKRSLIMDYQQSETGISAFNRYIKNLRGILKVPAKTIERNSALNSIININTPPFLLKDPVTDNIGRLPESG